MRHKFLRWLAPALFVLVGFIGLVPSAHAAWTYEPLKWRHFGRGDLGFSEGSVTPRGSDTTYVSAAAARVDTTTEWNMMETEPQTPTSIGGTAADSSQIGAVIVTGDSAVASTFTWAATTITIQVNYGSQNTGWTTVGAAISPLGTTTQKAIIAPMIPCPVGTAHLGSTTFNAAYNYYAPRCRALVTWGTAAAVPSARVYVRKWIGSSVVAQPRSTQLVAP